jgi:hypothetical protein
VSRSYSSVPATVVGSGAKSDATHIVMVIGWLGRDAVTSGDGAMVVPTSVGTSVGDDIGRDVQAAIVSMMSRNRAVAGVRILRAIILLPGRIVEGRVLV